MRVVHKGLAWIGVAMVTISAAALFTLLRLQGTPEVATTFAGACERIYGSGLPPQPGDAFCTIPDWHISGNYAVASLTIAIALAFPCFILALNGRRWTALLPLVGAPATTYLLDRGWLFGFGAETATGSVWISGLLNLLALVAPAAILDRFIARRAAVEARWLPLLRIGVAGGCITLCLIVVSVAGPFIAFDAPPSWNSPGALFTNLLLIAAPAMSVMIVTERTPGIRVGRSAAIRAGIACSVGSSLILLASRGIMQDGGLGVLFTGSPMVVVGQGITIGLFGAILGTDRRWWPWSIIVAALLLSHGPSLVDYFPTASEIDDRWAAYASAVPLAIVGLVCSGWAPLAARFDVRRRGAPEPPNVPHSRIRPAMVANALAISLLIVSQLMVMADPLPRELAIPLPTFDGLRARAAEARVMMNFKIAATAANRHLAREGSLAGFHADVAERLAPELAWREGLPSDPDQGRPLERLEAIVIHDGDDLRIATLQGDIAYCLGVDRRGRTTWGSAEDTPSVENVDSVRAAVEACTSESWSPALIRIPPLPACDDEQTYLICRMVQVLVHNQLATPAPGSA